MEKSYLKHEGIQGMHWYERNGPPYPLSTARRSAEERRKNPESKSAKEKYVDAEYKEIKSNPLKKRVSRATKVSENARIANTVVKQGSELSFNSARIADAKAKQEHDKARNSLMSEAKGMSDEELRSKINRLQLEKQFVDLSSSNITAGAEYTNQKQVLEMTSMHLNNLATTALVVATIAPVIAKAAPKILK